MRKLNLKGQEGFTFLTSLFDLMVLLTLLPLIALFFGYVSAASMGMDAKHLEWQLFSVELPHYLNGVESIEVINNGGGVRMVQSGVEYDIELYAKLIRKQKFRQGHEIMLTGIETCRFSISGTRLTVEVEFSNGIRKVADYVFSPA
ncbi:MAG TPA: competence type IV pilus minor pilin ComGF [Planococcus sp. (in: firmicutes)]|nr:competence type IV pilus minor pilin ComGF [Planococcus sp. (in: firmicutes)]